MSTNNTLQRLKDANLLKQYHSNLIFDYTEYPTKSFWKESFNYQEYEKILVDWLKKNSKAPILFYIHTPFCEQLCYFCLCSKEITKDYKKVESYLYDYLFKEIDILFNILKKNQIKLNVKEIYFGGGSPTYYKEKEFKAIMDKIKEKIEFDNVGDVTVEIDPRRVDEEKLMFYNDCGVNRISFGVQDFDYEVQKRINRIQPAKLLEDLLTEKIRKTYQAFNFDLLIGLPGQTTESIERTIKKVIEIKPTQLQTLMMHYKPGTRKYMINMLREGPLPDFYDRKIFYSIVEKELLKAGYEKTGYEMFALPNDPITKAIADNKALYASLGTQKGDATNFVAVGSSAHGCLGNDYYMQNFYELNKYREAIDNGQLPIYRGLKLSDDDKIRQNVIKTIRTYFKINYNEINQKFSIDFTHYFKKEINDLDIFLKDQFIEFDDNGFKLTDLGIHFSPQIANTFDSYHKIDFQAKKVSA